MAPRRTVVLSGFMATGKSTVGRKVAERLGLPFVDTDDLVARAAGAPTPEVFQREGEARFREREADIVLPLLADGTPRVVAFGGGTVTVRRVRYAALEAATVVTLEAAPETIVSRTASLQDRPNLATRSPLERATDLLALRREAYAECHARVSTDGRSPDEIADVVAARARHDALVVPLGARSYTVEMCEDEPGRVTEAVRALAPSSILVVTDANVAAARGDWLERALAPLGARRRTVTIVPGEGSKTLSTIERIWDEGLESGAERDAVVVAFGGGVVGDLAGFAASTLLRGVRCVQIATSLLAMVDSSVGGKTGFDHARGKNLIGSFFQPERAIVDLAHLSTLPPRERAAGLAEVVKIALVRDAALLALLEERADAIAAGDVAALRGVVRAAIAAKVRVVRDDERESSVRALLNLGHTVGHALEAHGGFRRWIHGEAVAIGTVREIAACEQLMLSPKGTSKLAAKLLARLGLDPRVDDADLAAAWPFVLSDKKMAAGGVLKLPVVTGWGEGAVERVPIDVFRAALGL